MKIKLLISRLKSKLMGKSKYQVFVEGVMKEYAGGDDKIKERAQYLLYELPTRKFVSILRGHAKVYESGRLEDITSKDFVLDYFALQEALKSALKILEDPK